MVQPTGNFLQTQRTPTIRMDNVYETNTNFDDVNPNQNSNPSSNGDFLTVFNSSLKNLQDVVGKNAENSKNLRIGQDNLLQRLGAIALSLKELSDRFPEFKNSMDQQRTYIEGLLSDLQKKDGELAQSNQEIQELTQEKANLQNEIEQNKALIEEMKRNSEEEMQKTQQEMDSMKQEYASLQQSGDERDIAHKDELARAIQEKQDELQKMQGEHDEMLKTQQSSLEKLEQEKSNVSNDLQGLMQENADLKKENSQLIENIKNATMIINNVVNKLQKMADAKGLSSKFQNYYDEIEEYIKLISNTLQGAKLSGGKQKRRTLRRKTLRRRGKKGTKKVGRKNRNTKKVKKHLRGGFVYGKRRTLKTHRFTSRRKSSRR